MSVTTTPYVRPDGTPYSPADTSRIDQYAEDLMSGRVFALHAASDRSRLYGGPPIASRSYAHALEVLGRMAGQGQQFAQVAQAIVREIPLYQTDGEASAKVYEVASKAIADGWTDVIGRSGPEAGRWRDYDRSWSLYGALVLGYYLAEATADWDSGVPGVGWCFDALARAQGVVVPVFHFDRVRLWNRRDA